MKKRILLAFILAFGTFSLFCGCEDSTVTPSSDLQTSSSSASAGAGSEVSEPVVASSPSASETSSLVSSADSSTISSQLPIPSYTERSVRVGKGEQPFKIKVGEEQYISLIHSPTYMTGVTVDFKISDETVIQFVYDEHDRREKKYPSGCVITALKPGEATISITVTSKEGDCSTSCTVIVEE